MATTVIDTAGRQVVVPLKPALNLADSHPTSGTAALEPCGQVTSEAFMMPPPEDASPIGGTDRASAKPIDQEQEHSAEPGHGEPRAEGDPRRGGNETDREQGYRQQLAQQLPSARHPFRHRRLPVSGIARPEA